MGFTGSLNLQWFCMATCFAQWICRYILIVINNQKYNVLIVINLILEEVIFVFCRNANWLGKEWVCIVGNRWSVSDLKYANEKGKSRD